MISVSFSRIVPVDGVTVVIGAAVPTERKMKTKSWKYVTIALFCALKKLFKGSLGLIFFTQISDGAKMMKIYRLNLHLNEGCCLS